LIRYLYILLFVSFQLHAIEAEPLPRVFGYVIGDILEQRVALTINGETIELTEQPLEQRVGPWVQRLSSDTTVDKQGNSWLTMRYQIINAPFEPQEVALPALVLTTNTTTPFELSPQPFSLSPLTLERKSSNNTFPFMMPDRVPSLANAQLIQRKLYFALLALGITTLAWLAWWLWLRQRDKKTLPFSKAMYELRKLRGNRTQSVNDNSEAWSAVHEAFNTLAGQTLTSHTAKVQLKGRHWLEPFSSDINAFYTTSDQRFFKPNAPQASFELYKFCKSLYNAEKRNTAKSKASSMK